MVQEPLPDGVALSDISRKLLLYDPWEEEQAAPTGALKVSAHYIVNDARRHPRSWLIGLFTIMLVVCFLALLQNAIQRSPYIFLRLAELTVGEMDVLMTRESSNTTAMSSSASASNAAGGAASALDQLFLNHTHVAERTASLYSVEGTSPRWILPVVVSNKYVPANSLRAVALMVDTLHEQEIGIGRGFYHRPLGEGEAHVTSALLRILGVQPNYGQRIMLTIDVSQMLSTAGIPGFSGTNNASSQTTSALVLAQTLFGLDLTQNYSLNSTLFFQATGMTRPPGFPDTITLSGQQLFDIGLPFYLSLVNLQLEYIVVDGVEDPAGKWPTALGNVVLIDSVYVKRTVFSALVSQILSNPLSLLLGLSAQQVQQRINGFPLNDYAMSSVVMMTNRIQQYVKPKAEREAALIRFSNDIALAVGLQFDLTANASASAGGGSPSSGSSSISTAFIGAAYAFPIALQMDATAIVRTFLDQIFLLVLVLMVILGSMLIYSLLLANTEEKTYEYGMLRALGLRQNSLLMVIFGQSLAFAIPGVGLGLLFGFLLSIPVAIVLANFVIAPPDYSLATSAILIATVVGFVIPLVANIVPTRKALSKTLRDALDIAHQAFAETSVTMTRLEHLGIEPWQTALGLLLCVFGFIVYYLLPYATVFQDFDLFLTILVSIVIGMLIGMCLLLQPFEIHIERLFLPLLLLLYPADRRLKTLIRKSMIGHRPRSAKTAMMFTVAIAFIVFAGVTFSLMAKTIPMTLESILGSDVVVDSMNVNYDLPRDAMVAFLQTEAGLPESVVFDYSFMTNNIILAPHMRRSRHSNFVNFPALSTQIFGVERSYLRSTYGQFFMVTEKQESFDYPIVPGTTDVPNVVQVMIDTAGQARFSGEMSGTYVPPVILGSFMRDLNATADNPFRESYLSYVDNIISEATRDFMSLDTNTPQKLTEYATSAGLSGEAKNVQLGGVSFMGKARAMIRKAPGIFGFSSYAVSVFLAPQIVSTDAMQDMLDRVMESANRQLPAGSPPLSSSVQYDRAFVRLNAGVSKRDREDFVNRIRSLLNADMAQVADVVAIIESTQTATDALMLFFTLVAILASILCFFILWLSFIANVRENSWEFGVLRSIGLSVNALIRAYIYEAMVLVLACLVLGTLIGIVIGIAIISTFNLFFELPFMFGFPYVLYFSVLAMSLVTALVASYLPARTLKRTEISQVIRGL